MKDFLLELGTEELPVWAQLEAEKGLLNGIKRLLEEKHIEFEDIRGSSTPRRVFVYVKNVQEAQRVVEKTIKGPPIKVAYKDGKPTPALMGFLRQRGLTEEDIEKKDGYIYAKVEEGGEETKNILSENLPDIIRQLKFKKVMRWNGGDAFPRPVRWILAIFGKDVVEFEVFGLKSGRYTQGHRFLGRKDIVIKDPAEYETVLAENGVIVDRNRRKDILLSRLREVAKRVGGAPEEDEDLLEEVTGLVEWPGVLYGRFDKRFLDLPHIVIKAAMKQHQRYFPVVDREGNLLPYFLSAINNEEKYADNIRPGMEEVLVSRLEDAEFYFKEDMKIPPHERVRMLEEIVWMENVGTIKDKISYAIKLADYLLENTSIDIDQSRLKEAIVLAKFDLTTQMIRDGKEFTKLEGEIAKEYAKRAGIDREVAEIIGEHMLPRRYGDRIPQRKEAAIISIIFRILDLVALLKQDYNFSSSRDPYGARRNTYAIFEIIVGHGFNIDLKALILKAMEIMGVSEKKFEILWNYIKERLFNFLEEREKIRYDIVDAIIEVNSDIFDVWQRAKVLDSMMKKEPEAFEKIAISLKRVNNILKNIEHFPEINPGIMGEYEKALYEAATSLEPELSRLIKEKKYETFLSKILALSPRIDEFFDNVFVMTEDEKLRKNRLALLNYVKNLFKLYGDFSKLAV